MKNIIVTVTALAAGAFIVGCQAMPYQPYARQVKVSPQKGGIVALNLNHRDEDRTKADSLMQRTCASKSVTILEEGEVVVGTVTSSTASEKEAQKGQKTGSLFGIPMMTGGTDATTNTNSETTQKKEWQIKFNCEKASKKKTHAANN